jgi:hypothetical protein
MRNFLKTKGLKNKKKLKKTKRNKNTNRTKKTKKTKKTRKFIKMSGGVLAELLNYIRTGFFKEPNTEPIKINTINGDSIYSITIEGLKYYFFGQNKKYVLVIIDDTNFNIYKLENDIAEVPNDTKMQITRLINNPFGIECPEGMELLNENKILYFKHHLDFKGLTADLNLNDAQKKLRELNNLLQTKKCSNLSLRLDYVYNHNNNSTLELFTFGDIYSLVLCLYIENHCISSITITIKKNGEELSIDTKTHDKYINRKYNILLCSILIIISPYLSRDIRYINIIAINPASAYIMMQYFRGKLVIYENDSEDSNNSNTQLLNLARENDIELYTPSTNYKNLFELYKSKYGETSLHRFVIEVKLTPDNKQNAYNKFNDLLTGTIQITCPDVLINK